MNQNKKATLASVLSLILLGCDQHSLFSAFDGSKEKVRKRLLALDKVALAPGSIPVAMCYAPAAPPLLDRADYICPTCGFRTVYMRSGSQDDREPMRAIEYLIPGELDGMRQMIKGIHGLNVSLDESGLCHHCSPLAQNPSLTLVVKWPDGTSVRTPNITRDDLQLLIRFGPSDPKTVSPERLTKLEILRLKYLLGIPEEGVTRFP